VEERELERTRYMVEGMPFIGGIDDEGLGGDTQNGGGGWQQTVSRY
jgi:hypothetical protein